MTGQGAFGTRIVVTGANGSAGMNLLAHANTDGNVAVVAWFVPSAQPLP